MQAVNDSKAVASVVSLVAIKDLKAAPWNPPNRIDASRLKKLQTSIEDIGLLYPVLIDESNRLVDGHRRVAVAKRLGWSRIACIKVTSEFEHTYGSVQLNQERLTGNDIINVYLSNPNALLSTQRRKTERIEEVCGRKTVEMLAKTGLTPGIFDIAMRVVRYLKATVEPKQTLHWLIKHSLGGRVRHLLDSGISETTLKKAILNDTPLKIRMTAD